MDIVCTTVGAAVGRDVPGNVFTYALRRRGAAGGRLYMPAFRQGGGYVATVVFRHAWRRRDDVDIVSTTVRCDRGCGAFTWESATVG